MYIFIIVHKYLKIVKQVHWFTLVAKQLND